MPCARVIGGVEEQDHPLVVIGPRVRPTVGRAAARHGDVAAHLDAGAEKLDGCAAVELEPEVQFGVAHNLAIQSSGQAELQDLTQIFVDPGAGFSCPLTVLADPNSMILQPGERILVGLRC